MRLEDLKRYGLVYLATPYTKYPGQERLGGHDGIECAFIDASQVMAKIIKRGVLNFYSPIVHIHPIAIYGGINPKDDPLWVACNKFMINKSDVLVVAMMVTWQESVGIKKEIEAFQSAGKPIYHLDPETLEIKELVSAAF